MCYPLVFFDAIRVKIRDEGFVRNKAVYIALKVPARSRGTDNVIFEAPVRTDFFE